MRIVTRPDFDGVVCAALLSETESITRPVLWAEPNDIQNGIVSIRAGDIIANLPFHPACSMWFDHHYTNKIETLFDGAYKIAPSAAGVVYEHYKKHLQRDYDELIRETDKIDAAELSQDEVNRPEKYPYLLLSMTIYGGKNLNETYWNRLVELIRTSSIEEILEDPEVKKRCKTVIAQNKYFKTILSRYTRMAGHVSITDFRSLEESPPGNRFLVYSLFPEAVVSLKIRYKNLHKEKVVIGVGHSIFNRNCNVNVGLMLTRFGGGGHHGAGACTVAAFKAEKTLKTILEILRKNESNEK